MHCALRVLLAARRRPVSPDADPACGQSRPHAVEQRASGRRPWHQHGRPLL